MTDFRPLLERMANELDYLRQLLADDRREIHALAAEARAALAQPADGKVAELVAALDQLASAAEMYGPVGGADGRALNDAVAFARFALARRGSAAPVPVSRRPWESEGWCDENGECWMGDPGGDGFIPSWRKCRPEDATRMRVSLPAHALPLPSEEEAP